MDIASETYKELEKRFEHMGQNQVLVVTAFALEKMWKPYVEGIQKSGCSKTEVSEMLQMAEQCMYRIWERIKQGKPFPEDYNNWSKMCDRFNDMFDEDEVEFCEEALWFDGELIGSAWVFFNEAKFDVKYCAGTVSRVLEMIIGRIGDVLHEYYPKLEKQNHTQYESIISNHPAVLNELKRIDMDIKLAERYPNNLEEILNKGSEYHKLNLWDIQPPEAYGIHVEIN